MRKKQETNVTCPTCGTELAIAGKKVTIAENPAASIKQAQLPIPRETQVLPGHGEFSTFGAELDNNYYIRSALRGGNDIF